MNLESDKSKDQLSHLSLLEKISTAKEPDVVRLLEQLQGVCKSGSVTQGELSFASHVGWVTDIECSIDLEEISALVRRSKKLLKFYVSVQQCHFSPVELLEITDLKGFTTLRPAVIARLRSLPSVPDRRQISERYFPILLTNLESGDLAAASQLVKKVFIPISCPVERSEIVKIVSGLYKAFDPTKKPSATLSSLAGEIFQWLLALENRLEFEFAIGDLVQLTSASFAQFFKAMKKVPIGPTSPQVILLELLIKTPQRNLSSVLVQEGVLETFSLRDLGTMLSVDAINELLRSDGNQKVCSALGEDIVKKGRKESPEESLAVFIRYPRLLDWCEIDRVLEKYRTLSLPILNRLMDIATQESQLDSARKFAKLEQDLRTTSENFDLQISNLQEENMLVKSRANALESRLRGEAKEIQTLRDDEIRVARMAMLKQHIEMIDAIEVARNSPGSIESLILHHRALLTKDGIEVQLAEGDETEFDPRVHEGVGLEVGEGCVVVSPAYLAKSEQDNLVIRKAMVRKK